MSAPIILRCGGCNLTIRSLYAAHHRNHRCLSTWESVLPPNNPISSIYEHYTECSACGHLHHISNPSDTYCYLCGSVGAFHSPIELQP